MIVQTSKCSELLECERKAFEVRERCRAIAGLDKKRGKNYVSESLRKEELTVVELGKKGEALRQARDLLHESFHVSLERTLKRCQEGAGGDPSTQGQGGRLHAQLHEECRCG